MDVNQIMTFLLGYSAVFYMVLLVNLPNGPAGQAFGAQTRRSPRKILAVQRRKTSIFAGRCAPPERTRQAYAFGVFLTLPRRAPKAAASELEKARKFSKTYCIFSVLGLDWPRSLIEI
ncbi:MAG: hypothetical protein PHY12_04880 [Eubacteriales bacterium]|nr:hypothetical protein [Eubacteriales bacterium]